jgi:hypothetical protein
MNLSPGERVFYAGRNSFCNRISEFAKPPLCRPNSERAFAWFPTAAISFFTHYEPRRSLSSASRIARGMLRRCRPASYTSEPNGPIGGRCACRA